MSEAAIPARPELQAWIGGRRRLILSAGMLVYPGIAAGAVHEYSSGAAAIVGYVIVGAFIAGYVGMTFWSRRGTTKAYWVLLVALALLFVASFWFVQINAFYLGAVVTSLTVLPLRAWAAPGVLVLALAAIFVPLWIPGWGGQPGWTEAVMVIFTALLWYAFAEIARANDALIQSRGEVARLASEAERNRIARDLHDLVGHSLTAITVKSNLARQLAAKENSPALREITEVEQLSRQALADVRAAVSGYREVTLSGELARARELLRASGITADIPTAVEPADSTAQSLFGWAVREAVTNVVRHSGATHCSIAVLADSVTITDDGRGAGGPEGNGLTGLRERAGQSGGVVTTEAMTPRGWRLRVTLATAVTS